MTVFEPRDEAFRDRVRGSFERQPFVNFIGAELTLVDPGAVDIAEAVAAQRHRDHLAVDRDRMLLRIGQSFALAVEGCLESRRNTARQRHHHNS